MKRLNPNKLFVEYRKGVLPTLPIIPRLYTLTHSDETGELFLIIDDKYAEDKITSMRDEVRAEWIPYGDDDVALYITLHIDGEDGPHVSYIRNNIFIKELPLALEAIRYGDREFFNINYELNNAPIFIEFQSIYPEFNRIEYWGNPINYT